MPKAHTPNRPQPRHRLMSSVRQAMSTALTYTLDTLQIFHAKAYNVISRFIKTQKGKMTVIALFAFAIGAFISKMIFINDWKTLMSFIVGGVLGAGAVLVGVYFEVIK